MEFVIVLGFLFPTKIFRWLLYTIVITHSAYRSASLGILYMHNHFLPATPFASAGSDDFASAACAFFPVDFGPAAFDCCPLIRSRRWSIGCSVDVSSVASAFASQPRPNLARKAANFPASSSSTFNSFCELGFHKGVLRWSLVLLYTGAGEVVRCRNVEPSESVTS